MSKDSKLVCDKIPQIIEDSGRKPIVKTLNDADYEAELEKKLAEEIQEYLQDKNAEELADILEVVYALGNKLGVTKEELEKLRQTKRDERGGFREKLLLVDIKK